MFASGVAVSVIDDDFEFTRFVFDVVPTQTVAVKTAGGILGRPALTLAVDEEFARWVVGLAVDGCHLADAVPIILLRESPTPMG